MDDKLFSGKAEPKESGAVAGGAASPPGANGNDPTASQPMTLETAAELVRQSQAPLLERIEQLTEAMGQVTGRMSAGTQDPNLNVDPGDADDFLTQFSADPRKAIEAVVAGQFRTVAPLIGNIMNATTNSATAAEAERVNNDFGTGAWESLIEKPLKTIIESYRQHNAAALSDPRTIVKEINGLKGQLLNELVDHREKHQKSAADANANKEKELVDGVLQHVRTNLTGGIRRMDTVGEEVTDSLRGYLEERDRSIGGETDPKQWLSETNYGNTIDDYVKHQASLKAKGGQ